MTNSLIFTDSSAVEAVVLVLMNIYMEMDQVPLNKSSSAMAGKVCGSVVRIPSPS